ncbi:N-acetyltransferase 6-like [Acanthaster planci]|uniref:N-acetyltransferase 6-like n=1 Tax=Acanthaster planci TaxID=133434 RepID=A0A8B7Z2J5_ACAPL|nr:N-acetyltransferase 6-like [Acanthaster planci]
MHAHPGVEKLIFYWIMACSYSLRPLRTVPNLIPSCVKILKEEWPHCKAHLLPALVKQELALAPCSYGLVRHVHAGDAGDARDEGTLVGHVRLIPVTNRQRAIYGESLCVDKAERGRGLGELIIARREELLRRLGYLELHVTTYAHRKDYYLRRFYSMLDKPAHTLGANILQTSVAVGTHPCFVSWHGNVLYPGLESEYEGGAIATEKEVADGSSGVCFVKYLRGTEHINSEKRAQTLFP